MNLCSTEQGKNINSTSCVRDIFLSLHRLWSHKPVQVQYMLISSGTWASNPPAEEASQCITTTDERWRSFETSCQRKPITLLISCNSGERESCQFWFASDDDGGDGSAIYPGVNTSMQRGSEHFNRGNK
ncbi:hypothetical protein JOB18_035570 [Solea senegalensis]|uniref:Uncharacterized protein n=1 Tax=Solea senegalensis TaxID=28829 RepID=A0AAV6R1I5_SOLSE|nr:hypothetical protein JOB18_035570 [Solea senegalensis]